MKTTFMANEGNITRKWYIVDAEGKGFDGSGAPADYSSEPIFMRTRRA